MSNNNTVNLNIRLTGNAGRELQQLTQQQTRGVQQINQGWRQVSTTQGQYARGLNTARTSQEQINRLTQQTTQSLQAQRRQNELMVNLLRQNAANARRMQEAINNINLRRTVGDSERLNHNLSETTSKMQKLKNFAGGVGQVGGGVIAAGAVLQKPIEDGRTYDEKLARMTVTATDSNMSIAARNAVQNELNATIMQAARTGGGSRDNIASAADTLIASGQYNVADLKQVLTATSRTAFASGASTEDAAKVTLAMKNFGIAADEMAKAQEIAYAGGKMGRFEYKDQAQFLPTQMAAAKTAGYIGADGLRHLVAMNQVAMNVAGTSGEAGNYITNLLGKFTAQDFSKAIADNITVRKGDATRMEGKGKKAQQVFDWESYAQEQRNQGINQAQALVKLIDREMANNKDYQALKIQSSNAKSDKERLQTLEAMQNMLAGSKIGSILTDREARLGALAVSQFSGQYNEIYNGLKNADGTIAGDTAFLQSKEFASNQDKQNEVLNANYNAYLKVNGTLDQFNGKMAEAMAKNEGLGTAAYMATEAIKALAAGAAMGGIIGMISGGGGGAAAGGIAGTVASRAGGLMTAGRAAIGGVAGSAGMVAGAVGYGIGTIINKTLVENNATLSDRIGGTIHTILANMGVQSSKEALDQHFNSLINETQQNSQKYDQMIQEQRQTRTAIQQQTNAIRAIDLNVTMPSPVIQQISNPLRNIPTAFNTITNANPQNNPKRGTGVFIPYRH